MQSFQQKNYESHLKRLHSVKGAIDNSPPESWIKAHAKQNNQKRAVMANYRQKQIDYENRRLLTKLAEVMTRKPEIPINHPVKRYNPLIEQREREIQRIDRENQGIIKRIIQVSQKSEYDRAQMLKDYERQQMAHKKNTRRALV
eukprot:Partr_v1_DN28188_c0_g1_i4_m55032